jgi:hypothetical protein
MNPSLLRYYIQIGEKSKLYKPTESQCLSFLSAHLSKIFISPTNNEQDVQKRVYIFKSWHVDPLLGNDREINNYTTAVAKQ